MWRMEKRPSLEKRAIQKKNVLDITGCLVVQQAFFIRNMLRGRTISFRGSMHPVESYTSATQKQHTTLGLNFHRFLTIKLDTIYTPVQLYSF